MTTEPDTSTLTRERADIIESLRRHRGFLRTTTDGITDAQGLEQSTVSALTLSGLIKHVADTEEQWVDFAVKGAAAFGGDVDWSEFDNAAPEEFVDTRFVVAADETVAGLLERYAAVAQRTDALVATIDLDSAHPLPSAPWFESGAVWSARRVFLHVIAETSQHAGHADIIREAIDGAKTMG